MNKWVNLPFTTWLSAIRFSNMGLSYPPISIWHNIRAWLSTCILFITVYWVHMLKWDTLSAPLHFTYLSWPLWSDPDTRLQRNGWAYKAGPASMAFQGSHGRECWIISALFKVQDIGWRGLYWNATMLARHNNNHTTNVSYTGSISNTLIIDTSHSTIVHVSIRSIRNVNCHIFLKSSKIFDCTFFLNENVFNTIIFLLLGNPVSINTFWFATCFNYGPHEGRTLICSSPEIFTRVLLYPPHVTFA